MEVVYDDEAFEEAMEAAAWYESRDESLARRFLTKWKEAETRKAADPERNRMFEVALRSCRFEVFPYALIYRCAGKDSIQVIAVMHLHREPRYWEDRDA